jgi:DNA mismatch endonuclease, patch repair protein
MVDVVSPAVRSRMMAGIKSKNTKPEVLLRRALHAKGFRFRLHSTSVPGRPDMIFPKYRAAVFVNGCFWHGHDCKYFKLPSTRPEFWAQKITRNKARDAVVTSQLDEAGWHQLTVWECSLRGTNAGSAAAETVAHWLTSLGKGTRPAPRKRAALRRV